ncbi:MAG: Coenzyme A biosynthesis bifunctional protein CoaBC [Ignavibacteria bacterium]|nr:Coenzyme A biosynthesis bifunctional protein CoaBC [Ignavibacteria bacterium]
MLKGKKILIGISGGIAAYKICTLVRLLVKQGAEVRIIMTPSAVNFVSPVTLSVLSGNEVFINMFPESPDLCNAEKTELKTWHVNFGLWADVFLIAPATANTIAKISAGIADNFLLASVLASKCPVIISPSMDDDMYKNHVTTFNIDKLKFSGYKIIEPEYGELASGLVGEGRMPEPEKLFGYLKEFFDKKSDLSGKKILITAGPTVEFIDKVRFVSNPSTGKMGFEIARAAKDRGAEVTLISGPVMLNDIAGVKRINVTSADEMLKSVKLNLRNKDLIVMAAAVEDFRPVKKVNTKIKKEDKNRFVFEFEKTPDILYFLGKNKKRYKLAGFALETENLLENAKKKLKEKNLDFIVLNNPDIHGAGFGTNTNVITIIDTKSTKSYPLMSKYDAGNEILNKFLSLK